MASFQKPRVSVIIPSFNRAHCVGAAIASARAQSVADIEILVVDDGSTDETARLVGDIADPRVRLIQHERNRGAAAARNSALALAQGEFVALLDSDDTWLPGKLDAQIAALQAAPESESVSCTGFYLHLSEHSVTRTIRGKQGEDWKRLIALGCDLSPGSTMMMRRETLAIVGPFDETLPRFEDWDWLFRYTRQGAIAMVDAPLAHIHHVRGRMGDEVALSTKLYFAKHAQAYGAMTGSVRRKAISDAWLQVVANYGFEGRYRDALGPFARAFRLRPMVASLRALRGVGYALRGRALAALRGD